MTVGVTRDTEAEAEAERVNSKLKACSRTRSVNKHAKGGMFSKITIRRMTKFQVVGKVASRKPIIRVCFPVGETIEVIKGTLRGKYIIITTKGERFDTRKGEYVW